jgi:hypothetical protein
MLFFKARQEDNAASLCHSKAAFVSPQPEATTTLNLMPYLQTHEK